MSDYLPGDVLSDILERHVAKDLVRCITVCKKWYALIRSPSFISLHLKQSQEDKDRNYLLVGTQSHSQGHYYLFPEDAFHEHKKFTIQFKLYFRIICCCKGLDCLFIDRGFDEHNMILIWSPLIRKGINVLAHDVTLDRSSSYIVRFGFDSATNDHKFIQITYPPPRSLDKPLVQVYSLNKGITTHKILHQFQQAYICGAAHWLAVARNNHFLIVVFDMKDGMFREMHIPERICFDRIPDQNMILHVYQESISLFHFYSCYYLKLGCDISLMREYGVQESCTRQFKFDFLTSILGKELWSKVIGMRSNGEVFFTSQEGKLLSSHCEKILVSDLKIKGIEYFCISDVFVGAYTESLVLLDKGED